MAKKLRFTKMDSAIMVTINEILETRFVRVMACADIRKSISNLNNDIEIATRKLEELDEKSDSFKADSESFQAQIEGYKTEIKILENRRSGIMAYTNPILYGDNKLGIEGGFNSVLKARGVDFYDYYVNALNSKSISDTQNSDGFATGMKTMVKDTFKLEAPDTLLNKFCNWMIKTSLYYKGATGTQIVNGQLVTKVGRRAYYEVLFGNLIQYIDEKGGVEIIVPTKENYDYVVEYDEGCHPTTFKMVLKTEDQKQAEKEAAEQAKAEKKEQAKARRQAKKAEKAA